MRLVEKQLKGYVFTWENIYPDRPDTDDEDNLRNLLKDNLRNLLKDNLRNLLKDNFHLTWASNANFKKTTDDLSITISNNHNSGSIIFDKLKMRSSIVIDGQIYNTFIAKKEDDKTKFYKRDILTVWFNAWRYEREEYFALIALLKTIAYAMGEHPYYREIRPILLRALKILGKDLLLQASSKYITDKGIEAFQKKLLPKMELLAEMDKDTIYFDGLNKIESEMKNIVGKYVMNKGRIVVFIDDLDRCTDEKALEVFESIKVFLDIAGFIFIIGLSYEAIVKLIEAKYKRIGLEKVNGEEYIRKLIQMEISIPEWKDYAIVKLIEQYASGLDENNKRTVNDLKEIIAEAAEKNPRQIKRFINRFVTFVAANDSLNPTIFIVLEALRKKWSNAYEEMTNSDFRRYLQNYIDMSENYRAEQIEGLKSRENDDKRPLNNIEMIIIKLDNEFWKFLTKYKVLYNIPEEDWARYQTASEATKFDVPLVKTAIHAQPVSRNPEEVSKIQTVKRPQVPFRGEQALFVGRAAQINQIKLLLKESNNPISIIGPGGTGKSQLAFKAIHVSEDMFDIIIPIYFKSNLTFTEFLSEIAQVLSLSINELQKQGTEMLQTAIIEKIKDKKRPLIFADGYEIISQTLALHKEDYQEEAARINEFLDTLPSNVAVILTSRQRRNLERERLVELVDMKVEEGLELFLNLARDEYLTRNEIAIKKIKELVSKIGGHPLSIALLARSYKGGGLDEISNLIEKLNVNVQDSVRPEEQLISLKASLDYTSQHIDDNLRKLLRRLVIFRSPFPISAAEKIFNAHRADIFQLYDHSFLSQIESDNIYGKIENPENWLYTIVPVLKYYLIELNSLENVNVDKEYGEIYSEYYSSMLYQIYDSLVMKNDLDSARQFRIIHEGENNDFDESVRLTTSDPLKALLYSTIGIILQRLSEFFSAIDYFRQALSIHERMGEIAGMANDYGNMGVVLSKIDEHQQALEYHKKALDIHTTLEDKVGMANDYGNMGVVLSKIDEHQQALEYHKKALDIHTTLEDKVGMANDYGNMGVVFRSLGDYEKALEYHKKALEIDMQIEDKVGIANDYGNMGVVFRSLGDYEKALEYHKKALEIDMQIEDKVGIANDYWNIADVLDKMGKNDEASSYREMINKKELS